MFVANHVRGINLSYFHLRSIKMILKSRKRESVTSKDLISNKELVKLLENLEDELFLPVFFMAATGRRAADISKIETKNVSVVKDALLIALNGDKVNQTFVGFSLNWNEDQVLIPFVKKAKCLWKSIKTREKPFQNTNWQQIRRSTTSRLHSLRNRKAIILLMADASVEEVKLRLGWADIASLVRYTKIEPNSLKLFDSYDDFISKLSSK